ncbi:hybrid-cluster NAD(P)-dependent oxidoreductase [Jatrophihabitans endophyticus]|uniref:hybrid-cluster NAD(P)-dependent oxidoreductase n=1 Tax=Jatrophihabitans endophyticus TaxID=1206085 RepID=UPI0019E0BF40|nr:hybrid-cluster NAD(P)-dependent oxidoreductase [Jatrophihabitans endophyticus]MBE7187411.1 hybrid-cluster NAD(P)-dependent oxidoreductase [Jatrophihabitans endophyticus]
MTGVLSATADPLVWSGPDTAVDEALVCRRVEPVTHDVTSFVLASPTGRDFAFEAGQYVTVTAMVGGRHVERCYTISSPSTCTDEVTITVKRVPGGPMSNWLHDHLAVGDRLQVTGPLGRFTAAAAVHDAPKYLFLSAGSGITPVMSITRTLLSLGDAGLDAVFVHSARSPRDIVFRGELDGVTHPGLRVGVVCEDDAPDERWSGPRGRLSLELLRRLAPDLADREVFTCGPAPYMAAVREMLTQAGVDPSRCHEESFELGSAAPTPPPVVPGGAAYSVQFRRSGRSVDCGPGTSILQAALAAGIPLPSSCGEGVCGTCKTSLVSGQVDMQHAGGIRPREIAAGKVLLCCSTPLDDVVLDA